MRIRISHETRYRYDAPINGVIQTLRLTPRNHDGQYVGRWRIDVSEDCRLDAHEDAFGNITHTFTAEGPFAELAVQVEGEIDPDKYAGYVQRGTSLSPIGRLGEAIDQAHLVHYLASDASKFATGAIFRVNGGVGIVW